MKKKKIQNIIIVTIIILIIGSIVAYNYSVDQTKQKGLQFGIELNQIQDDVNQLQIKFYSEKIRWEEEDISKEGLLEFYEEHLIKFKEIISRYDKLTPPELFKSSVELLKLSSETQLQSDSEFIGGGRRSSGSRPRGEMGWRLRGEARHGTGCLVLQR